MMLLGIVCMVLVAVAFFRAIQYLKKIKRFQECFGFDPRQPEVKKKVAVALRRLALHEYDRGRNMMILSERTARLNVQLMPVHETMNGKGWSLNKSSLALPLTEDLAELRRKWIQLAFEAYISPFGRAREIARDMGFSTPLLTQILKEEG